MVDYLQPSTPFDPQFPYLHGGSTMGLSSPTGDCVAAGATDNKPVTLSLLWTYAYIAQIWQVICVPLANTTGTTISGITHAGSYGPF